ncbi:MAG: DUF1579 domain-containing protein [Luteolibacter sp.]
MSTAQTPEAPATGMPQMPSPVAEHAWLERLAGEWKTAAELQCMPDQPPMKTVGHDSSRMLGGFWLISETRSESPEMPFGAIFTIGYSPEKQKYIATWVDTMTSRLWTYEGEVTDNGTVLTFHTEGSCPMEPGKTMRFRERIQLITPDHKLFTSAIQGDDGEWRTCVTVHGHRVK